MGALNHGPIPQNIPIPSTTLASITHTKSTIELLTCSWTPNPTNFVFTKIDQNSKQISCNRIRYIQDVIWSFKIIVQKKSVIYNFLIEYFYLESIQLCIHNLCSPLTQQLLNRSQWNFSGMIHEVALTGRKNFSISKKPQKTISQMV